MEQALVSVVGSLQPVNDKKQKFPLDNLFCDTVTAFWNVSKYAGHTGTSAWWDSHQLFGSVRYLPVCQAGLLRWACSNFNVKVLMYSFSACSPSTTTATTTWFLKSRQQNLDQITAARQGTLSESICLGATPKCYTSRHVWSFGMAKSSKRERCKNRWVRKHDTSSGTPYEAYKLDVQSTNKAKEIGGNKM